MRTNPFALLGLRKIVDTQEFNRLVSEDVKNLLPPEKADILRMPSNQVQWRDSLLNLLKNLDEQIEGLNQDEVVATKSLPSHLITDYKIQTDEKKTKVNRFRFYVIQRLSESERMIALGEDGQNPDLTLADFLKKAIYEHQSLMSEYEFESTPIDRALWRSAEGEWGFLGLKKELENWI